MKTFAKLFALFILTGILMNCRQQPKEYQVFALYFCNEGTSLAKEAIIGYNGNDSVEWPNYFWLLKDPDGRNILVDAGWIDSTHVTRKFIRPDSVLLQLNIGPQEISDIIITHPHYDHIGGISLFPNARVWMNQDEYEYFVGPAWKEGGDSTGFTRQDVINIETIKKQGRLKLVKGDDIEIMPGIKAYTGSTHTHEDMYLLINPNSERNKILLASDAVWFYINLEKELPVSLCADTAKYVNAMRRMKTLVSDQNLIIPGHDIGVMSRFPSVNDRIVRIKQGKQQNP
ncbi:MAG TPA: N-acyl homoserine lactonase family protein [Bacteroidales bacterium]|nr:N-acyl homoserine lactonase family protein [Bacteroidales bacterium]